MGFEALDVASMIVQQSALPLFEENTAYAIVNTAEIATNFIALSLSPELLMIASEQGLTLQTSTIGGEQQLVVTGHISPEVETLLIAEVRGAKKQEQLREKVAQHNALTSAQRAPASRGAVFAPIP